MKLVSNERKYKLWKLKLKEVVSFDNFMQIKFFFVDVIKVFYFVLEEPFLHFFGLILQISEFFPNCFPITNILLDFLELPYDFIMKAQIFILSFLFLQLIMQRLQDAFKF